MIDGTYQVEAKTPLGKKKGAVVLQTSDDACIADLQVKKKTKRLEGKLQDELVTFTGDVKLPRPFGKVNFVLAGTVVGDDLFGVCRTKKFSFDVMGTRVL